MSLIGNAAVESTLRHSLSHLVVAVALPDIGFGCIYSAVVWPAWVVGRLATAGT